MWFRASEAAWRPHSLRRRLLLLVLLAIAVASAAQAVTAYRSALQTADAVFDLQLQELARSLQAGGPFGRGATRLYEFSVEIWGPEGIRSYRSEGIQLPIQPVIGFSDAVVDGVRYRVYQLRAPGRTVQVAQNLDERRARARELALRAALPGALLAPLLMLAVWLLIDRSMRPVERMRRLVAARRPEDLSPLPEQSLPAEIAPLVHELNLLFDRTKHALAVQQQFVADAAHELRSPLGALKLQAQDVRRLAPGTEREAAIERLNQGIERAVRLASQLLALARAEAGGEAFDEWRTVDLAELCKTCVEDVLGAAHARKVDLGVSALEPAQIAGAPEALRMLLRNVLENAVKFAPEGGRVDLALRRRNGDAVITVEDNGPGIDPAQRERVFDRFYRGPGQEASPGSGLGLAIAAAVAKRHRATLRLDRSASLGGLKVEISFPPLD